MMGAYRLFAHEHAPTSHPAGPCGRGPGAGAPTVLRAGHPGHQRTGLHPPPALEGTGPLAAEERQGFFLHTQWVVTDQRLPLGTWQGQITAREPSDGRPTGASACLGGEGKLSLAGGLPGRLRAGGPGPRRPSHLDGDRENDIYEIYVEWQQRRQANRPAADWLIRLQPKNRVLREDPSHPPAWAEATTARRRPVGARGGRPLARPVAQQPVVGGVSFTISVQGAVKKVHGGNRQATFRQGRTVRQEIASPR